MEITRQIIKRFYFLQKYDEWNEKYCIESLILVKTKWINKKNESTSRIMG